MRRVIRSQAAKGVGIDRKAVAALERFWGASNGGTEAWNTLESSLRGQGLDATALRLLRLNLPITETGVGTTAAKIDRCARLLEIMEGE